MFVNFNQVFNKKPEANTVIPSALIQYLNSSLPAGAKYVVDENGHCVVVNDGQPITLGGFKFIPNAAQLEVLGNSFTREDVLNYSYNSQKPIALTLDKEGYVLLNGVEFPIEKMAYNPFCPIKYVSGSFSMFPQKFPEPFPMRIGNDEYEREVFVQRIPNNSVDVAMFKSIEDSPISISFSVNPKKESITINVSYSILKAKSIRDIIETVSIYNAYLDGNGTLMGKPLDSKLNSDTAKHYDESSLKFWKKVSEIETLLGVEFIPPQDGVDVETICFVEQLYQNLINGIPIRTNQIVNAVNGKWDVEIFEQELSEATKKPMYFEFETVSQIELFGVKAELPAVIGIFNAAISDYDKTAQKLILEDESPQKKRYSTMMFFKNEDSLQVFKQKKHNDRITLFHDAKRPTDYL